MQTLFNDISQLTGLNVGCFYAVGTLLNRMIIEHYPVSPAYTGSIWKDILYRGLEKLVPLIYLRCTSSSQLHILAALTVAFKGRHLW